MPDNHKISEFIDNISFKKTLGGGFRPDEVYDTICQLTSIYNEVLADSYRENDQLKQMLESRTAEKPKEPTSADKKEERRMLADKPNLSNEIDFTADYSMDKFVRKNFSFYNNTDSDHETEEKPAIKEESNDKPLKPMKKEKRQRSRKVCGKALIFFQPHHIHSNRFNNLFSTAHCTQSHNN